MSEFDPADEVPIEDRPDEEEFAGTARGADSEDTGTHYDEFGEAETTPHDLELDRELDLDVDDGPGE